MIQQTNKSCYVFSKKTCLIIFAVCNLLINIFILIGLIVTSRSVSELASSAQNERVSLTQVVKEIQEEQRKRKDNVYKVGSLEQRIEEMENE